MFSTITTHGLSTTRAYKSWNSMMHRCYNPSYSAYADYGGKGIKVADRWHTFMNFLQDMGQPAPKMSLGRKDSKLGYSPENCRWEDMYQQNNNRSSNIILEYEGLKMTLAQWARHIGLSYETVHGRYRSGYSIAHILSPKKRKRRRGSYQPNLLDRGDKVGMEIAY